MLPKLYPILDSTLSETSSSGLISIATEIMAGGATILQYRNKRGDGLEMLSQARELRRIAPEGVTLIMNDRADLCVAADFGGVHTGQDDLTPAAVRRAIGPSRLVGISTHSREQVEEAEAGPADYIAVGPVFATSSKANPDPVIGIEGVRAFRALTRKPLVAIGGINRANCRSVIDAGADSIAVISEFLQETRKRTEEFLRLLG